MRGKKLYLTHPDGTTKTVKEWSHYYGVDENTFRHRVRRGDKHENFRRWHDYEPPQNYTATPETIINGEVVTWEVKTSDGVAVASSIVKRCDGWGWNCYEIGTYKKLSELVDKIIKFQIKNEVYQ